MDKNSPDIHDNLYKENEWKKVKFILNWFLGLMGLVYGLQQVATITTSITAETTSQANSQSNPTFYLGLQEAKITGAFESAIQACRFYQATYKDLHPYTVLWEVSESESYKKDEDPEIRVIAKDIIWDAHTCIKQNRDPNNRNKKDPIIKLIGDESLTHRLEVKFTENKQYKHIADVKAYYRSVLHFDDNGRIVHRKIRHAKTFNCVLPESLKEEFEKIEKEKKGSREDAKRCNIVDELPKLPEGVDHNYNDVEITYPAGEPSFENPDEKREYAFAIWLYIEKRIKLHDDLGEHGCVAISVEPIPSDNNIEQPSIIFMCHKNNKSSHIRAIVRESYEEKKKREEKKR